MNKELKFLAFLQNCNDILINNYEEFEMFEAVLERHGLSSLLLGRDYTRRQFQLGVYGQCFAECQCGKGGIAVYPMKKGGMEALEEWYGVKPMSVSDIDDREAE